VMSLSARAELANKVEASTANKTSVRIVRVKLLMKFSSRGRFGFLLSGRNYLKFVTASSGTLQRCFVTMWVPYTSSSIQKMGKT